MKLSSFFLGVYKMKELENDKANQMKLYFDLTHSRNQDSRFHDETLS